MFLTLALASLSLWDLVADFTEGRSWPHLLTEALLFFVSIVGFIWVLRHLVSVRRSHRKLLIDVADKESELRQWKVSYQELLRGVGAQIDEAFGRWQLTGAEKEVGLLLLKGLSFKEMAQVRGTSEKTVRQQAASIYLKSDLPNRSEFAAYFLEDLLLPSQPI